MVGEPGAHDNDLEGARGLQQPDGLACPARRVRAQLPGVPKEALDRWAVAEARNHRVTAPGVLGELGQLHAEHAGLTLQSRQPRVHPGLPRETPGRAHDRRDVGAAVQQLQQRLAPDSARRAEQQHLGHREVDLSKRFMVS